MWINNLTYLGNYKIKTCNVDQNSVNGICLKDNKKFFYKVAEKEYISLEEKGYNLYSCYVYCSKIIERINIDEEFDCLIFEYDETIRNNEGLLCDLLNNEEVTEKSFFIINDILTEYSKTFDFVGNAESGLQAKRFFYEKVSRIYKWYSDKPSIKIQINNHLYYMERIISELMSFSTNYQMGKGILSHGDPGDLNFTIRPGFVDLATVGYNDFFLEFAIFFWNIYAGGIYFFPKYHYSKYAQHNLVYTANKIEFEYTVKDENLSVHNINITCTNQRIYLLNRIIDIFESIQPFSNSKSCKKNIVYFIIFRMLSIINAHQMEKEDKYFLYSLVVYIYQGLSYDGSIFDFLRLLVSKTMQSKSRLYSKVD